jgi:alkanesulfonate monooxygenase SsuD/methylene tetrahydromethanopterin reductase-like flavin-dependent oxidoreductase (luciferase family)
MAFHASSLGYLSWYAGLSNSCRLVAAATNPWSRNLAIEAQEIYTLAMQAPHRLAVGLAPWGEHRAAAIGVRRQKPLAELELSIEILRRLLQLEEISVDEGPFTLRRVQLAPPDGEAVSVPLLVGANGEKALQLAGKRADGAILNYLTDSEYTSWAIDVLRHARAAASVDSSFEISQLIFVSCHSDPNVAHARAREWLREHLMSDFPHFRRWSNIPELTLAELGNNGITEGRVAELLPPEIVGRLIITGDAAECAAGLEHRTRLGVDIAVMAPIAEPVEALEGILAALDKIEQRSRLGSRDDLGGGSHVGK